MTKIQLRRGTAAQWTSVNPVLASGEMGIETDTNKFKFGDGVTNWNNLDYVITGEVITDYTELDNLPSINNITLTGNKSASDLGLQEELINGTGILISGTTISVDDSVVAMRSDIPDVSNFVTNSSLSTTLQDYQPVLESGTNIKTINNQSLLGSGNIEIQSGGTYSEGTGIDITNGVISVDTDIVALKSDIPSLTGYATQTWVQNQNYLTSISSSDVISALGYTPYSSANPNNYTSNIGTVTSVNSIQPDANGNVSITIPDNTDFMDLSTNQTAYGTKTFNDLRVHQYIRNVDGKVIFYGVGSSFSIGDTTCELTLDGSTTRPRYYNGTTNSEMALLSDIPDIDNSTITKNTSDELQTIGVIDDNVQNAYNFTVVGSPKITADGVASGFSSSKYIRTLTNPIIDVNRPFKIKTKFNFTYGSGAAQALWQLTGTSGWYNYCSLGNSIIAYLELSDSSHITVSIKRKLSDGNYTLIFEWTGSAYVLSVYDEAGTLIDSNSITTTLTLNAITSNTRINIGCDKHSNYYWISSIDLKQFSITVDGVEVYKAWQPPAIKYWTGTKAQYDAIVTKDATTLYFLSDIGKIYFGDTLISNKSNGSNLFDFKWADHELDDMSWSRADTFSWQSGNTYTSAYNHLVSDIQGKTAETETVGSYTVTFYRATDGHKICLADQESTVLNIYNTYGIAWYYIVDTTNTQFKFPRTKYGFEGLRTNVGDNINESLPTPSHTHTRGDMNITGDLKVSGSNGGLDGFSGAFYEGDSLSQAVAFGQGRSYKGKFDASRSWTGSTSQPNGLPSVYQNNAPVQERATQMYLYFYVGEYSQTAIQQTAGLNAELFNNKLDLNASNLSAQGMSYIAGMGMPSNKYINLTLGASGSQYTAPANGWFIFSKRGTAAGQWMTADCGAQRQCYTSSNNYAEATIYMAVKKGDVLTLHYDLGGENVFSRFIYAQGSESEAN